jgi:hypothetical protein
MDFGIKEVVRRYCGILLRHQNVLALQNDSAKYRKRNQWKIYHNGGEMVWFEFL